MADATDLKSVDPKGSCGFESRHRYQEFKEERLPDLILKPFSRFEDEEPLRPIGCNFLAPTCARIDVDFL